MQSFERLLIVWQNQQETRVLGKRGEKVSDRQVLEGFVSGTDVWN